MKLKDLTFLIAILTSVVFVVACGGGKDVDAPAVAVKEIVSTDTLELTPAPDAGPTRSTSPSMTVAPTFDETLTIDILNHSSYMTSDIRRWVSLSEAISLYIKRITADLEFSGLTTFSRVRL